MTAEEVGHASSRADKGSPRPYMLSGSAAEMYERNMVPSIFEPFANDLLEHANLKKGEAVLDVGCGTGILARLAWPQVAPTGRVVGLDTNAGMLEVARFAAQQRDFDIGWVEGNATKMPLDAGEFDVVLCQQGLQFFPDRPAALHEMRRVLGKGGRLALSVWRPIRFNPGHSVFADVLECRVSHGAAETRRAPFQLSDHNEIRKLVTGAGFQDVTTSLSTRVARFASAEAMVRIMVAGTPLGGAMGNDDSRALQTVIDEVTAGLADYVDDGGLAIPMQAWTVKARV